MNDHAWLRELLAAGMFTAHGDDIAALLAELDHLRARLEVTPQGPDGIDARDETIRALEGQRDALRADAWRYRAIKARHAYALVRRFIDRNGYRSHLAPAQIDAWADAAAQKVAEWDAAIDAARGMGEAP